MDYAIYKTINGVHARIVHTFTQEKCNHRAKAAAREKLNEMWLRILNLHHVISRNACHETDAFHYDYITSVNTFERIRFYIAPLH